MFVYVNIERSSQIIWGTVVSSMVTEVLQTVFKVSEETSAKRANCAGKGNIHPAYLSARLLISTPALNFVTISLEEEDNKLCATNSTKTV